MPDKTPALRIGIIAESEWAGVLSLLAGVFVGEGYVSEERSRRVNRREAIEPVATVLTATDAGHLLGVVVLPHPESPLRLMARPGEAEIRMLAVALAARGKGVGRALVAECIRRAGLPPHNAHAVVLWTQPQMTAAQRLYEQTGFVREPGRDAVLPSSGPGDQRNLHRWAYALTLAGFTGVSRPQALP